MTQARSERNIKLVLEYDGLNYFGFQRQPRHKTVQSELEAALSKLFNSTVKIAAASGRTDSGTSAAGQVVNFRVSSALACERIQKGLNALLPQDIAVMSVRNVKTDFHARYSARSKTYEYQVLNRSERSPLKSRHFYHVNQRLDLPEMKRAAKHLTGRHDFKSFCAADPAKPNREDTVRTVKRIEIIRRGDVVLFRIEADGFLYKMVRNIVGTLIDAGLGRTRAADTARILAARDRRQAGKTVPAAGLVLKSVKY